ncbi:hypothetical protein G6F24_018132 [Rhizopus arrhizus]|nr:hypothetical protein G6F24_018132 [Rhizopus arrhizus]
MVMQRPRQCAIIHALDLRAGQDRVRVQPDLGADAGGDQFVVAGEYIHLHAMRGQRLQCLRGGLLRRV